MKTTCLVAGGGPAGIMLAYLLARSGVQTLLVEKHGDFFRDFRGDTVHPSTTDLLAELGILDEFLTQVPHQTVEQLGIGFNGKTYDLVDFRHLPTACKYVVFMPQWDFLNFLADKAKQYPTFRLEMNTEVTGLLRDGDRVTGVSAQTPNGPIEIHADLTIACDGRWSVIREHSGLSLNEFPMPIDVLWFRLPRGESAPAPFLVNSLGALTDWGQVKLLSVRANRLRRWWQPGLLCIGDAAHAMSPVGGIGVNYAIADAVAAANTLAEPLRNGYVTDKDLRAVQKRRQTPTKIAQSLQGAQTTNLARLSKTEPPLWMLRLHPSNDCSAESSGLDSDANTSTSLRCTSPGRCRWSGPPAAPAASRCGDAPQPGYPWQCNPLEHFG